MASAAAAVAIPGSIRLTPTPRRHWPPQRPRWAATAQQQAMVGPAAAYAREMERLSAKEALLLALRDSGGFQSLVSGKILEMQKIDVNERIVGLERLNPTPRPTTSPFLEGRWNFEWFGDGSPESFAARIFFERSPTNFANFYGLNLQIKDNYSKLAANIKFLNSIEIKLLLSTKLSVEGPMRIKEEYVEGIIDAPSVRDEDVPEQLKGILGQVSSIVQQLPAPMRDAIGNVPMRDVIANAPLRDAISNGLKLPLNGVRERFFMVSYLDEEILVIRDSTGAPDVLTRLEGDPAASSTEPSITEYES